MEADPMPAVGELSEGTDASGQTSVARTALLNGARDSHHCNSVTLFGPTKERPPLPLRYIWYDALHCWRFDRQLAARAIFRTLPNTGNSMANSTPMMPITTTSSASEKPRR